MKNLNVVFMGTPEFAVNILEKLIESTNVILVVSQPDAVVGRKKLLEASPVKQCALEHNIPVICPNKIRNDYQSIIDVKPDIIITCAYGQIIPKELLDLPKLGAINVHASLLPKYRGGAPIHRAIINGEAQTGITIMYMDEHMDSGDIISQQAIPIEIEDNLDTLSDKLSLLGANLLIETLPKIINKTNDRIKQDESLVTFGYVIKREDELIDFNKTTIEVFNKIRGLSSKPGAYFILNNKQVKVFNAKIGTSKGSPSKIINIYKDGIGIATKDGEIILTDIQPEGKKRLSVKDYLNGIDKKDLEGRVVNEREN